MSCTSVPIHLLFPLWHMIGTADLFFPDNNDTYVYRTYFLSFSTKLIVGDFLRPTGTSDSTGDEKYDR
jgi:hypothetical protein